ncbi:terminase large subunit [Burkholderia phage BcepNazgul]|uniref:Terminase, large subunit n=1 Tax=Burkholderia phage BcepNazgul TaxID=242861 RepID=Q6UYH7_9CAUD|nr:terminase large subunit [Burkholderia phage BcepNazgul]AAQ63364.2 terminase large subunit TerL [Burkholderia phage BcepNazgul]
MVIDLADIFRPPERLTVSQAAAKYRKLNTPGAYVGDWFNETVPYMVEPMNTLTSRDFDAEVFVGPAQCGKTDGLLLNFVGYTVKVDPMDMILYCPTNSAARDFSVRRIDRMHRHSPEIGAMMARSRDTDNKFDKHYKDGTILTLSWPSVTEFAGRPIGRVCLTDYDRMPDDVDGDGEPFDLASKRTTTFGSFAMTLAESSPSREIEEDGRKWLASSPHEAPPCKGILGLYNRGDRRRRYWKCPHCGDWFEPTFKLLKWDDCGDAVSCADTVRMEAPCCGGRIEADQRNDLDLWGVWLKDGESMTADDKRVGTPRRSRIASFWMNGVVAAFISWRKLVANYITAEEDYERTGSQESLKKFYNTDLGEPYFHRGNETVLLPETLKARAEVLREKHVPKAVRFLIGICDVQKNMWVCNVFGIAPGNPYDIYVVDRFNVIKSQRVDHDGDREWVKPHAYLEDWQEVRTQVMEKMYPLDDDSGRVMQLKMTFCDSGGREGVTGMAYNFYRQLREEGLHGRFHLIKGEPKPGHPRTRVGYPDANHKDKWSAARGDVPVLFLNSNLLKDTALGRLEVVTPGSGMVHFPEWLPDSYYVQLVSERRTDKGWVATSVKRNESWDLLYYCLGANASVLLLTEKFDWSSPPSWAEEWDKNTLVADASEQRFAEKSSEEYDLAKIAAALA